MDDDERDETAEPTARTVSCPECAANAYAVVPDNALLLDGGERADGKVRVTCRDCEERFVVHFRTTGESLD